MGQHTGIRAGYYWLTDTEGYSGSILRICSEVFVRRYVAVTSVDGGVMDCTDTQLAAGWQSRGGIDYSPKLNHVGDVAHQLDGPDAPGYDEFYIFDVLRDLGERSP